MRKDLAPGVWTDAAGGLHFDLPIFLAANGYPDTDANRAMMIAVIKEQFSNVVELAQ